MGRIRYLDGLRGFAALQVVLLHLLSAFLPEAVFRTPTDSSLASAMHYSPLGLLYDGHDAVYLFFLISGFALTRAYGQANSITPVICSRFLRFALPLILCCYITWGIGCFVKGDYLTVAAITGSSWMAELWHYPQSALQPLRDAIVNGLLFGFYQQSPAANLFSSVAQPIAHSLLPPMWTLNVEIRGTILVLLLNKLRQASPRKWIGISVGLGLLFSLDQFLCFVVGHAAAASRLDERLPKTGWLVGMPLCAIGLLIFWQAQQGWPIALNGMCQSQWIAPFTCENADVVLRIYGAIAVFLGITLSTALRGVFTHPTLQRLGQISFPLYLIHWPIVYGVAVEIFLWLQPNCGETLSALFAIGAGIGLSLVAARVLLPFDETAQHIAKHVRSMIAIGLRWLRFHLGRVLSPALLKPPNR